MPCFSLKIEKTSAASQHAAEVVERSKKQLLYGELLLSPDKGIQLQDVIGHYLVMVDIEALTVFL